MPATPPEPPQHLQEPRHVTSFKVAIIGDSSVGKTSLMIKYINNKYNGTYTKTLGVNYMERIIEMASSDLRVTIYDIGGEREFQNMLPLASTDAQGFIFTFDLTRKETLQNLKNWYKLARGTNRSALPVLVGTKFDEFIEMSDDYQKEIREESMKYAKAMSCGVVFTSSSESINVQKVFKLLLLQWFDLPHDEFQEIHGEGEPLLIFRVV